MRFRLVPTDDRFFGLFSDSAANAAECARRLADVFANIDDLQEGDLIVFTGEDEVQYTFAVQWTQLVEVATMDTDTLQELVGPTDAENVTLVTCGGEFDYNTGEYLSRTVVRGERVLPETTEDAEADEDADADD